MMELRNVSVDCSGVLMRWIIPTNGKVTEGSAVAEVLPPNASCPTKVICGSEGTLKTQHAKIGATVTEGDSIADIEVCTHPALFKDLCVSCGKKTGEMKSSAAGGAKPIQHAKLTVAGGYTMTLSHTEARKVQQFKIDALKKYRKLALVLDLDNTLLHASATKAHSPEIMAGATPLFIEEGGKKSRFFVKFRPQLDLFLNECSKIFEMTVYTHGTRKYAEGVCKIMDPEGTLFGKRIVSRTDNPDLGMDKSLSRLFLEDWSMAVVLDDREDVWRGEQQTHLVCIKPYVYFHNTGFGLKPDGVVIGGSGEVNNAPGLLSTASLATVGDADDSKGSMSSSVSAIKEGELAAAMEHVSSEDAVNEVKREGEHSVTGNPPTPLQQRENRDAACLMRSFEILRELHARYFNLPIPTTIQCPISPISLPIDSGVDAEETEIVKATTAGASSEAAGRNLVATSSEQIANSDQVSCNIREARSPSSFSAGDGVLSVGRILTSMRRETLRGCVLCFSGLIPIGTTNPHKHPLWIMAAKLGAALSSTLNQHTTHLLTLSPDTRKSLQCIQRGNVFICHPDWLLNCHWHIRREPELAFLVAPPPSLPVIMYYPPYPSPDHRPDTPSSCASNRSSPSEEEGETIDGGVNRKRNISAVIRPAFSRSNAGEFGVSYNTDSSSGEDSSSDEDKMRHKVRRTETRVKSADDSSEEESSDSSNSGGDSSEDDEWIQEMEDAVMAATKEAIEGGVNPPQIESPDN